MKKEVCENTDRIVSKYHFHLGCLLIYDLNVPDTIDSISNLPRVKWQAFPCFLSVVISAHNIAFRLQEKLFRLRSMCSCTNVN